MILCPTCGKETKEGKFCSKCGEPLNNEVNNIQENQIQKQQPQNIQQQETQNLQQNSYNQNYQNNNSFQENNNVRPTNQKSKAVGIILNVILVGLGYAYVGKWGEGLIMLIIYMLMIFLGFFLFFPFIIALALWVYTLIKTNDMIDKYNQGLPY